MEQQDKLSEMLRARYMPPQAPSNLAERIIHAAMQDLQARQMPRNLWAEISVMFALPHPSVVMATLVIFGVVVGIQAGDSLIPLGQDWSSFLDINEGGWL